MTGGKRGESCAPLVREFRRLAASDRPREVLQWCRERSDSELDMITEQERAGARDAANDESSTAATLEAWARRLELLADAHDARRTSADDWLASRLGGDLTPAVRLRELAANLRRAPEWRAERKAEWERSKPRPRVGEAMALHANCWREEPVSERLKSIEHAQRRLGELVEEARADGDWEDVTAISESATSVWRLRESLERTAGDEGPHV